MFNSQQFGQFIRLAFSRPVILRGLFYGILVGTVLNAINHGPNLICGEYSPRCVVQMSLTFLVPYVVSTLSSVQAMVGQRQSA